MEKAVCVFLPLIVCCNAYQRFRDIIPNGYNVPNPCTHGHWNGVGHKDKVGGGVRNPFGIDFKKNGLLWNEAICAMDSDGDGVTNGEELGDPDCAWTIGKTPLRTENISHPGICEPLNVSNCLGKNSWLQCSKNDEICQPLQQNDILSRVLRFPKSLIPAKTTSYFCMIFDLPAEDTYHLVGSKPIIDNEDITHHILLFGCNEQEHQVDSTPVPYECGMLAHKQCVSIIGTWTVGSHGDCFHNSTGFKIGTLGFKRAAMQIHWNNPLKTSNLTDSSGLELFYTKSLRQYDAGMFATGQEYLEIPPGISDISFKSSCSSECTKVMFPNSIFITRAVNHMHYKGIKQRIEIYRDGRKVTDITNDQNYNYDRPMFYEFEPPIKINPGDEIRTTCTYSSLTSNGTTYFGDGTSDEMCYGFITYYPVQNITLPYCTTWKTVEKCKRYMPQFGGLINGCKWREFLSSANEFIGFMILQLAMHCDTTTTTCSSNCTERVKRIREHECLIGDLGDFMVHKIQKTHPIIRLLNDCFLQNKMGTIEIRVSYLLICCLISCILKEIFK